MARPLADLLRPQEIEEVSGQKHLLKKGAVLRNIIDSGNITNMIFYGPSGVGKTTVANIIANKCGKKLYYLNATVASTSEIKEIINSLNGFDAQGGVLLYLDEIQYFNKKQQQILLSFIESGDITLIASTTENPFFYVYNAILSRSSVFEFKALDKEDIEEVIENAIKKINKNENSDYSILEDAKEQLALSASGDVRRALNMLELSLLQLKGLKKNVIDKEITEETVKNNAIRYDRNGDEHYDLLSAYQKSMRGSDPDAAVFYLCKILEAGDLPSACRRLMVCASEDVGLAYPQIIPIVKAAVDTANAVGLPEARIPLSDAVILVALSPKSNSAYEAYSKAESDIKSGKGRKIPRTLQNKHCDGEDDLVHSQNYLYPHSFKNHYVKQQYLPDDVKDRKYYIAGENKFEQNAKDYFDKIK